MSECKWDEFWYLVAVPKGELFSEAVRIQKVLSDSLHIYKKTPPLIHITISAVKQLGKGELTEFSALVHEALSSYNTIRISSKSFECFTTPHKSLVLKIEDNEDLNNLQKELQAVLMEKGYLIMPAVANWIFHITIVSELFAFSHLPEEEFKKLCQRISLRKSPITGWIKSLELWRPSLDRKERVIAIYPIESTC
ncbi:MAG: 2'-5' RNA ligase family protein [Bacillota bacterium]